MSTAQFPLDNYAPQVTDALDGASYAVASIIWNNSTGNDIRRAYPTVDAARKALLRHKGSARMTNKTTRVLDDGAVLITWTLTSATDPDSVVGYASVDDRGFRADETYVLVRARLAGVGVLAGAVVDAYTDAHALAYELAEDAARVRLAAVDPAARRGSAYVDLRRSWTAPGDVCASISTAREDDSYSFEAIRGGVETVLSGARPMVEPTSVGVVVFHVPVCADCLDAALVSAWQNLRDAAADPAPESLPELIVRPHHAFDVVRMREMAVDYIGSDEWAGLVRCRGCAGPLAGSEFGDYAAGRVGQARNGRAPHEVLDAALRQRDMAATDWMTDRRRADRAERDAQAHRLDDATLAHWVRLWLDAEAEFTGSDRFVATRIDAESWIATHRHSGAPEPLDTIGTWESARDAVLADIDRAAADPATNPDRAATADALARIATPEEPLLTSASGHVWRVLRGAGETVLTIGTWESARDAVLTDMAPENRDGARVDVERATRMIDVRRAAPGSAVRVELGSTTWEIRYDARA